MNGPFKNKWKGHFLFDYYLFMLLFFQNYPPDLSQCVFVIDQALSVRALQELLSAGTDGAVSIFNHFEYNFFLRDLNYSIFQMFTRGHHQPYVNQ